MNFTLATKKQGDQKNDQGINRLNFAPSSRIKETPKKVLKVRLLAKAKVLQDHQEVRVEVQDVQRRGEAEVQHVRVRTYQLLVSKQTINALKLLLDDDDDDDDDDDALATSHRSSASPPRILKPYDQSSSHQPYFPISRPEATTYDFHIYRAFTLLIPQPACMHIVSLNRSPHADTPIRRSASRSG